MWWKEPVTTLKGVGVKKAAELAALNIFSVGDLLEFTRVRVLISIMPSSKRLRSLM